MALPAPVELQPGKVYRSSDFRQWSANPTRLAGRLVREGRLRRLGHGLFAAPEVYWFGEAPPAEEELLNRLLDGAPWIYSGSNAWNRLGLGSTGVHAQTLVYNTKRSGPVEIDRRRFIFKRRAFPLNPPTEYFVVDLLHHTSEAGVGRDVVEHYLARSLALGRFDQERLMDMAARFGTAQEKAAVRRAMREAA